MYSTDAGAAAAVLRGGERESWGGLTSESRPAELSATQTHGVHPRGTELGTFTENHPGNTGREAEISFVLESPPGNSVVDTLKGAEGKRLFI